MRRLRHLVSLMLAALLLSLPAAAGADVSDTAVKAAFLPRFARYVSWPASAMPRGSDPFVLCVIGDDPFGASLDQAARSQSVDGRRIVVRRLESATGADGCQIAFVDGNRNQPTGQLLAGLGHRPVLTVTDSANGGQRGLVHFTVASGRVRFFIDQAGATQRGLTVSSRLLALAVGVNQR
jgi:uncharacterized protein DUF4154